MPTRYFSTSRSEFSPSSVSPLVRFLASELDAGSEPVKSELSRLGVRSVLAPGTASAVQKEKPSLEEEVFRLKLEWIMAKTDDEKRRLSEEIRKKISQA